MKKPIRTIFPILLAVLFITFGLMLDFGFFNKLHKLIISDLRDIAKILVQIQATVAVLSFSLLALIGSFLDKTFWGISVSDFYYNKKNPLLTTKVIIIIELGIIISSIYALLLDMYNLLFMHFFTTIFLIIYSLNNIYKIFAGSEAIEDDIKEYLNELYSSGTSKLKRDSIKCFLEDWEKSISKQSQHEFSKQKEFFLQSLSILFTNSDEDLITYICKKTHSLINILLSSSEADINNGILLTEDIYIQILYETDLQKIKKNEAFKSFTLLSGVYSKLCEALKTAPKSMIKEFNWYTFLSYTDRTAIQFNLKYKSLELEASNRISLFMGSLEGENSEII